MKTRPIIATLLIFISAYIYPVLSIAQSGQVQANGIIIAYESFGSKESETFYLYQALMHNSLCGPLNFVMD